MLEHTERISFRISSVLSKVAPEPDPHTGSDQKVLPPMGSGVASLHPPPLHPLASPVAAPDPTKKYRYRYGDKILKDPPTLASLGRSYL